MKLSQIQSFLNNHKKSFLLSVIALPSSVAIFVVTFTILHIDFAHLAKASFGTWGDTSLIHACVGARGEPFLVTAGATCESGETQTTWLKDVDAGAGLTVTRSSSGATLSLTNTDGWMADNATWTYVSTNSFKISGADKTSIFTQGTRIKATNNGSTFYGTVEHSTFSTDTFVTLIPNSDYSLDNSAITVPYYSYQVSPAGYPGYFNYTPTATGFSTASTSAQYYVTGNMITIDYMADGTSNASTFTLSTPAGGNFSQVNTNVSVARIRDNGSLAATGGDVTFDAQNLRLYKDFAETGWTSSGQKSAFFTISYRYN